jgi:hypothetical protein
MKLGNWIPIHKAFSKSLPRDRPFTELEAMFSLSLDYEDNKTVTVSGYANLWGWSRKRVSNFLEKMMIDIIYPDQTAKKQNQRGQIALQIRNRSGTDKEQIRAIDSKWLKEEGNRSGTDKEQIRNRSGSTTINPNPNPNPNPKDNTNTSATKNAEFEKWWKSYPKRNGRRVGKKAALRMFKKVKESELGELRQGTANYFNECNGKPKDAHRFLRDKIWKEYLGKSVNGAKKNLTPEQQRSNDDFLAVLEEDEQRSMEV